MPYFICNRIRKNWEPVSNGYLPVHYQFWEKEEKKNSFHKYFRIKK